MTTNGFVDLGQNDRQLSRNWSQLTKMPARRKTAIEIRIDGPVAVFDAKHLRLISAAIEFPLRVFRAGSAGIEFDTMVAQFVDVEGGNAYIPRGLVNRVRTAFNAAGHEVTVSGQESWPATQRPISDSLASRNDQDVDKYLLDAIVTNPGGQIVVRTALDMVDAAAMIAVAYRDARVLLVVDNRKAALLLIKRWQRVTNRPITWDVEKWAGQTQICLVVTSASFKACSIDWDVVLFLGQRTPISNSGFRQAEEMWRAARYCIRQPMKRLDWNAALRLEAITGPVVFNGLHDATMPGVSVFLIHSPPLSDAQGCDALEAKRRQIWHNNFRNSRIADIAQALADSDLPALWNAGVLLDPEEFDNAEPSVALLVEGPEHARQLARLLPDWRLFNAGDHISVTYRAGEKRIMTMLAATKKPVILDAIVRADGTSADWPADFGTDNRANAFCPLVVVDLLDETGTSVSVATVNRCRDYWARGWKIKSAAPWIKTMAANNYGRRWITEKA